MAVVQAAQFRGNEAEAHSYLKGVVSGEPSSGMVRYAAYGDTGALGPDDWSRLGLSAPASVLAQQQQQLQQQAIQPAVQSLQAQIPETQAKFAQRTQVLEAERQPLQQRYQGLLDEITRRETRDIEQQKLATTREFAGRGLLPTGGGFEQFLGKQTQPISEFFGGQAKEVGLERESSLRQLANMIAGVPIEETEATRQIRNAIAQLQAGAGQTGVEQALSLYLAQQQQEQARLDRALTEREVALKERLGEQPTSPELQAVKSGSQLFSFNPRTGQFEFGPSTGGGGGVTESLEDIAARFGL